MFNATSNSPVSSEASSARRAHLLVYDIPSSAHFNPSEFLWRHGARINKSVWVIPDKNLAMLPIKAWEERGAVIEVVRFDERDGDTIMRLAKTALVSELGRIRDALDEAATEVTRRLSSIDTSNEEAFKKVKSHGYSASRRARLAIERMVECALTFDLTGDVEHLTNAVRQSVKAREAELWTRLEAAEKHLQITPTPEVEVEPAVEDALEVVENIEVEVPAETPVEAIVEKNEANDDWNVVDSFDCMDDAQ
jgi:uncharacterized protein YaiE (UPF0345 family)